MQKIIKNSVLCGALTLCQFAGLSASAANHHIQFKAGLEGGYVLDQRLQAPYCNAFDFAGADATCYQALNTSEHRLDKQFSGRVVWGVAYAADSQPYEINYEMGWGYYGIPLKNKTPIYAVSNNPHSTSNGVL